MYIDQNEKYLRKQPKEQILVKDNAAYHKSKEVDEFLKKITYQY